MGIEHYRLVPWEKHTLALTHTLKYKIETNFHKTQQRVTEVFEIKIQPFDTLPRKNDTS